MLNRTIREALRSDPGSVPLLAAKLEARQPWADAVLGWIFLAFAAGLAALALFEDADQQRQLIQAAVVPLVVASRCWSTSIWRGRGRRPGEREHPPPPFMHVPTRAAGF